MLNSGITANSTSMQKAVNSTPAETVNLKRYMPVEPLLKGGIYRNRGLQAWCDWLLGRHYFNNISLAIPHTLIPILKLCSDNREDVEIAHNRIGGYGVNAKKENVRIVITEDLPT